jgi:hypothetical protein
MLGTRRAQRLALICLGSTAALVVLLGLTAYLLGVEPEFYRRAATVPADSASESARGFVRESSQLFNAIENDPAWSAVFRAVELNAWLRHDFTVKHGDLLPPGVTDPRVAFEPDRMLVGFRAQMGPVRTVVSVVSRVWVPESNRVAIEFDKVRGGMLPLPLTLLVSRVTKVCEAANLSVEWKRHRGKMVALVRLADAKGPRIELTRAKVGDSVLQVAGRSRGLSERDQVARIVEPDAGSSQNDQPSDSPALR